ncbi:MAG: GlxA family transcriptional regulator [Pseudomonadota bacterium]
MGNHSDRAQSFAFVLTPSFSLLALASAIDGLRAANVALRMKAYSWRIHIVEGAAEASRASCGVSLEGAPLKGADCADVIVVCGGDQSHTFQNQDLAVFLRKAARRGAKVGALSEASFILAEAGLLEGRRSTIHWKCQHAYRERFPDLDIRSSLFEIDGPIFSCVGGTSALDLILNMVINDHGPEAASQVAENYHHDAIRTQQQGQKMSSILKYAAKSPDLLRALFIMEANIETPIRIKEICTQLSISNRQLDRLFHRHVGSTPLAYYRSMRLERASQLLAQTQLSISSVSAACGFASSSHLANAFKAQYGLSPRDFRRPAPL